MKEIFKDIPGYKGLYQVSNLGRVKSLSRKIRHEEGGFSVIKERILKQVKSNRYYIVNLYKNNNVKSKLVHQLVAISFLNHKPNGHKLTVDHINNIQTDNQLDNLQIITQRENLSKDKKNGSSKYVGVSWCRTKKIWRSSIHIKGKDKNLGNYKNEIDAHLAYQNKLKTL